VKRRLIGMRLNLRILGNRTAKLIGNKKDIKRVAKQLEFKDPSARYIYAYKQGWWDGMIKFVSDKNTFPIGLIPHVLDICEKLGIDAQVTDKRKPVFIPSHIPTQLGGKTLRDYQVNCVEDVFTNSIDDIPFPRGIISAATNAGKSLIAAAIVRSLRPEISCLILVHKIEIFNQFVRWFEEYFDESIGVYNSKENRIQNITIGMITTLHARRKKPEVKAMLQHYQCLIVDECHHASSDSWARVIGKSKAYYKIGLSGTALKLAPHRNMKLIGLFGPVITNITNKQLVDEGYSAKPHITMLNYNGTNAMNNERIQLWTDEVSLLTRKTKAVEKFGGNTYTMDGRVRQLRNNIYTLSYKLCISEDKARAKVMANIILKHEDEQVLIIVSKLDHGRYLRKYLSRHGITCTFVCGEDTPEDRISILDRFSKGIVKVLIATMIYKEGIDVPCIDVLFLAMAEKAPVTVLQTFGRGLRIREGKKHVPVYDFNDQGHRILRDHAAERFMIYKDEKFKPVFK
jgi:superfamily II DNA or RNA helicase